MCLVLVLSTLLSLLLLLLLEGEGVCGGEARLHQEIRKVDPRQAETSVDAAGWLEGQGPDSHPYLTLFL